MISAFEAVPAGRPDAILIALAPVFGSFTSCAAWRIPRGLNWVSDRSRCETCSVALAIRDLVPIVSFIVLRGRCRHCGERITPAWTIVELACLGVAIGAVALLPGHRSWAAAALGWLLVFLAALAWTKRAASTPTSTAG